MTMTQTWRRVVQLTGAIALTAAIAPMAFGQSAPGVQSQTAGGRWQGWLGCWTPVLVAPQGLSTVAEPANVCITLAPDAGAQAATFTTIADGKVVDRTTLNANAAHQENEHEGCKGFDMADWAGSGQRLYFRSEHLCDGGIERHSTAILSLNGAEFVDVRRVATTGTTGLVRAVHYRPLTDLSAIPAEILAGIPTDRGMAVSAARMASQQPLTTADVIDAVSNVDAPVVEAWLVERSQPLAIDSKQLLKLADAKVPPSVIDVVVAVSFPKVFAIDHAEFQGEQRPSTSTPVSGQMVGAAPYYDPFYDYYNYYGYEYGDGYGGYGSNGYNSAYNRLAFHAPYTGYYYGSRPVVVIVRSDGPITTGGTTIGTGTAQPTSNPKVVNGKGYTEGTSGTNSSPPSSNSSGSSASSGSSGSSGGSSAGASSSGSGASSAGAGSTGRTAIPKCTGPKC